MTHFKCDQRRFLALVAVRATGAGLGVLVALIISTESGWTGGPDGMPVERLTLFGWRVSGSYTWYWVTGGLLLVGGSREALAPVRARALADADIAPRILPADVFTFSTRPTTDDWPYLYLPRPVLPRYHVVVAVAALAVAAVFLRRVRVPGSGVDATMLLLGAGFMLLETRSITQFALLWGSTWVVASMAIASVLVMALVANDVVARSEIRRPWLVGLVLLALLSLNYFVPVGRVTFENRAAESVFYAVLMFSPILCAGLLFGSAFRRSQSIPLDFGANLLGAMAGGVAEYLSLITGFRTLLFVIGLCYVGALMTRKDPS